MAGQQDDINGVDGVDEADEFDGVMDLDLVDRASSLNAQLEGKWSSNCWTGKKFRELITSSETPEMTVLLPSINSNEDDTSERRGYAVHKALLYHFSPHHLAAPDSALATSTANQTTFETGASSVVLRAVVGWLYSGDFDLPETESEYGFLLELYYFATQADILALRRKVMDSLEAFFTLDIDDNYIIASYRIVRRAYELLGPDSPFIGWLQQTYAHHHYDVGSRAKHTEGVPAEFWRNVSRIREETGKDIELQEETCGCCGNICKFHEHESSAECVATCGS